jgi:hypothetical protein
MVEKEEKNLKREFDAAEKVERRAGAPSGRLPDRLIFQCSGVVLGPGNPLRQHQLALTFRVIF